MRTIRSVVSLALGLCLMLIVAANMTPVDLYLLPSVLGMADVGLKGIPLAMVIVAALLAGILVGVLVEFAREAKYRGMLEEKRKEIAQLREENARLIARFGAEAEDLALLPA